MNIIESEVWKGSELMILREKGSEGCRKGLNINCAPMDEGNDGWGKGRGWDGNLMEGSNGGGGKKEEYLII